METRPHLEQTANPTTQPDSPFGRLSYTAEDFEKRALTRPVTANNADDVASSDFKAHILQSPELLHFVTLNDLLPTKQIGCFANEIASFSTDNVSKCLVPLLLSRFMSNHVALGHVF